MPRKQPEDPLADCAGFDWDEWNTTRNWTRHRVTAEEAEDVFFYDPLLLRSDQQHSRGESRFQAMAAARAGSRLLIVFTVRKHLIRVISARDLTRR